MAWSKQTFVTCSTSLTASLPFSCLECVFFSPVFKASILNLPPTLHRAIHPSQASAESSPGKSSSFPPLGLCSVYLCTYSACFPLHLPKLCSLSVHSSSRIFLFIKFSRPPWPSPNVLMMPHYSMSTNQHHLELLINAEAQAPFRLPPWSCVSTRFLGTVAHKIVRGPAVHWLSPLDPSTSPSWDHLLYYFELFDFQVWHYTLYIFICSSSAPFKTILWANEQI